jgi:3-hydroxybutyryl-CoA dehydrogenase
MKGAMEDIQKVLVVGAGVMGHGIAQVFAVNSLDVTLVDQTDDMLQQAHGWIEENLQYLVELGGIDAAQVGKTLDRIRLTADLEAAAQGVDYVLEAVSENLELKKAVFRELDVAAPSKTILATNTSSFDINEFSSVTKHPERVIGTHWFHPPPITPCIEIIPAKTTSRETVERAIAFMKHIGKFPTTCCNAPGFVANRIQFAMAAEALAIVEEGLATPQEVDRIVKSSFGFRLSAYGPFEIADQAGLDTYQAIFQYLYDKLNRRQFKPSRLIGELIDQGRLGLKNQKGFYAYGGDAAQTIKRSRDRKLFERLRLFQNEQGPEEMED